jgi:hypothetical protein
LRVPSLGRQTAHVTLSCFVVSKVFRLDSDWEDDDDDDDPQ